MALLKENYYVRFKQYRLSIVENEGGRFRNLFIEIEVCNNDNKLQKQNADIMLSIPYSPSISETEIYNELKKQKIIIKGLFGEGVEVDLTTATDVFEEG